MSARFLGRVIEAGRAVVRPLEKQVRAAGRGFGNLSTKQKVGATAVTAGVLGDIFDVEEMIEAFAVGTANEGVNATAEANALSQGLLLLSPGEAAASCDSQLVTMQRMRYKALAGFLLSAFDDKGFMHFRDALNQLCWEDLEAWRANNDSDAVYGALALISAVLAAEGGALSPDAAGGPDLAPAAPATVVEETI